MAAKFAKGDLVRQLGGGPSMVVDALPGEKAHHTQRADEYWCRWFKGATRDGGSFGEHLLEPFVPPTAA